MSTNLDTPDLKIVPICRASTIPSHWYVDPEIFELEIAQVFERSWQLVGRTDQIAQPGAYFTCEVGREPLIVVRGQDDVVRAFSNVCRHRGGPVARGAGLIRSFQCSYHGWSYNLDGSLRAAPGLGAIEEFDKAKVVLPAARVEVLPPFVFVNVDLSAPPICKVLGDLSDHLARYDAENLRLVTRRTYDVACNWKALFDNFLECYHCPLIHRDSVAANVDLSGYVVESYDWYSRHYFASVHPDKLQPATRAKGSRQNVGRRQEAPPQQVRYTYCFFPNFAINLLPGWLITFQVVPLAFDRSLVLRDFLSENREKTIAELQKDSAVTYYEKVFAEDVEMVQLVQRQLRSKSYKFGRYSVRHEQGVYHFHSVLRRVLSDT
jgi:choline monooxygenase